MKSAAFLGLLLLIGGLLVTLHLGAHADWRACLDQTTARDWRPPRGTDLLFWVPVLPLALLGRKPGVLSWSLALAFLALVLWLLTDLSAFHDCDRKGTSSDFLPLLLTAPAFLLALLVLFLERRLAK